jgi:hypothetical protein
MKKLFILLLSLALTACSNSPAKRNSWQKKQDFKQRRDIYYNQFVESGGMLDDEGNPGKKMVQEALNQGSYFSN